MERIDLTDTDGQVNPSRNQRMGMDWQFLGELELPVGPDAPQTVYVWLTKSLKRLDLPGDFVNQVLKSAQEAIARAIRVEPVMKAEYIHVSLFVPPKHTQESQFWGFFRVEKIMDKAEDAVTHSQMIAFYLYLEG